MPSNTIFPQVPLSGPALSASSAAAVKNGVPVNIVRGVTTYKYGASPTPADFNYVANQLSQWYKELYPRYGGSALVNWVRSAAAEMGQGASNLDVATATANQSVAIQTILDAPFWAFVGGAEAAISAPDTTTPPSATPPEATTTPGGSTGTGTGSGSGAAGAGAGTALSGLKSAIKYSSLLAALADPQFTIRIVEIIAGVVLMFMGIKVLTTGSSTSNTIVRQAASVAKVVK